MHASAHLAPFRTLVAARDAIRTLRARRCGLPASGVTVHLRAGVHKFSQPLHLGPEDSGTAESPIEYRAYEGEDVLLSGGVAVRASDFRPRPGHPGQMQANLSALGVPPAVLALATTITGTMPLHHSPGAGGAGRPELFVAGQAATLARWPNIEANGSWAWAYTGDRFPRNCTTGGDGTPCKGFTWRTDGVGPPPAASHNWSAEPHGWLLGCEISLHR